MTQPLDYIHHGAGIVGGMSYLRNNKYISFWEVGLFNRVCYSKSHLKNQVKPKPVVFLSYLLHLLWALVRDSAELFSLLLIGPSTAGSIYNMLGTNASLWGEITNWVKRTLIGIQSGLNESGSLFDCWHFPFDASRAKIMFAGVFSIAVCHHFTEADGFVLFLCEVIGLPFLCCYYDHLFCPSTRWQKCVILQACYRLAFH